MASRLCRSLSTLKPVSLSVYTSNAPSGSLAYSGHVTGRAVSPDGCGGTFGSSVCAKLTEFLVVSQLCVKLEGTRTEEIHSLGIHSQQREISSMCRTQEMPVLHSFEYCMKMSLHQAVLFRLNKEKLTVSPTLVCSFRLLQHLPARGEERPITNKCCYPLVLRTSCTSTSLNNNPRNEQLLDLPNFESVTRTEWRTLQLNSEQLEGIYHVCTRT